MSRSKNETSTAEAEIVLSHVISFPIIKISWQLATRWIWVPHISQIQQNIWLKRRLNPFFTNFPPTNMRGEIFDSVPPFGGLQAKRGEQKPIEFLRFAKTLANAPGGEQNELIMAAECKSWNRLQSSRLRLNRRSARLRGISILYWKISISRPEQQSRAWINILDEQPAFISSSLWWLDLNVPWLGSHYSQYSSEFSSVGGGEKIGQKCRFNLTQSRPPHLRSEYNVLIMWLCREIKELGLVGTNVDQVLQKYLMTARRKIFNVQIADGL